MNLFPDHSFATASAECLADVQGMRTMPWPQHWRISHIYCDMGRRTEVIDWWGPNLEEYLREQGYNLFDPEIWEFDEDGTQAIRDEDGGDYDEWIATAVI